MRPSVARLVRHDLLVWRAIGLALRRRRDVSPGDAAIEYSAQVKPKFWVFFVVLPLEIAAVHLIVPWEPFRTALLVVGVVSAIWFLGIIASLHVYPHTVGRDGVRLRWAAFRDHRFPASRIRSVQKARRSWDLTFGSNVVDGTLVMDTDNETNLLLELSEPMELDTGRHGRQSVRTVALWADDQAQAATVIRAVAGAGGPDRA